LSSGEIYLTGVSYNASSLRSHIFENGQPKISEFF
jgi:hypothetical protein